jgi:hypothetical protein
MMWRMKEKLFGFDHHLFMNGGETVLTADDEVVLLLRMYKSAFPGMFFAFQLFPWG